MDEQEHTHKLIHSATGADGGPLNVPTDYTSEATYTHAHDDGFMPHHHVTANDADKPKPEDKPNLEDKVIGLWQDVKRDLS